MTERRAVDYAWQHPQPANIKAGGYERVGRYLSHDSSKDLTTAEAQGLHAQGLGIWLVWEFTANRAGQGAAAATEDARDAEAKATALGYPSGAPIFYAVDYDADPSAVLPYFRAVHQTAKHPVGVYGSLRVVEAVLRAGLATYGWQTAAWSGSTVSPLAHLYQRIKPVGAIPGALGGWDENVICKDFPVWGPAVKPAPAPAPAPRPVPQPITPASPPQPTRVTQARDLITQAINLCVASGRPRAKIAASVLRRVLTILPPA